MKLSEVLLDEPFMLGNRGPMPWRIAMVSDLYHIVSVGKVRTRGGHEVHRHKSLPGDTEVFKVIKCKKCEYPQRVLMRYKTLNGITTKVSCPSCKKSTTINESI